MTKLKRRPELGATSRRVSTWDGFMAQLMLDSYNWKGTLETCQSVLQDDPDHLGALELKAQALWLGGEYQEVINTTTRLLKLNPHEPGYRYTRGMAYLSQNNLAKAADDFRMAMDQSTDPGFQDQVAHALDAVEYWMTENLGNKLGNQAVVPHKDNSFFPAGRYN